MKKKLYTYDQNLNLLKQRNKGIVSSVERSFFTKKELGEIAFNSKEDLLSYFLPQDFKKAESWSIVLDVVKENGFRNILSLGAGPCVQEYLLKKALPPEVKIIATDFDSFTINKVKTFFPELIVEEFDFFKDEITDLQKRLGIEFDLVIFFGSSYVMDDIDFIKLFGDCKKIGVKRIIDFQAGYMNYKNVIMNYLPSNINNFIRKMFRKSTLPNKNNTALFHGYGRNRSELRSLYKKSDLKLQKELTNKTGYRYCAILK